MGITFPLQKKPEELLEFFSFLLEMENVVLENIEQFEKSLMWYKMGADFADAMHLAVCEKATLHTFDHKFCKKARELNMAPNIKIVVAK